MAPVAPFQNMRIGAELALVRGGDEFGAGLSLGRKRDVLKSSSSSLPSPSEEKIYLAGQNITIFLERDIHLSLDHPSHLRLILAEVIHHLCKCSLAGAVADRANVTQA